MRLPKIFMGISILIFSLAINGCNFFPNTNKTRPAPNRPRISTPAKKSPGVRPAPTKRTPGISGMTEKDIRDRLNKIDVAVKKGNWDIANRETNSLGIDMTRFRPTGAKGKSLRETANFNVMYAKLQADVKTKNKTATTKDISSLQNAMKNIKSSKS